MWAREPVRRGYVTGDPGACSLFSLVRLDESLRSQGCTQELGYRRRGGAHRRVVRFTCMTRWAS